MNDLILVHPILAKLFDFLKPIPPKFIQIHPKYLGNFPLIHMKVYIN